MSYISNELTFVTDAGLRIPVSDGVRTAIVALVKHGEKVPAIKLLREVHAAMHLSLRDGKDCVEAVYAHAGSPLPYPWNAKPLIRV